MKVIQCPVYVLQENQEALKYNYAREILITKSELESKNSLIEELKQKVDESKTECTYQLRWVHCTFTKDSG